MKNFRGTVAAFVLALLVSAAHAQVSAGVDTPSYFSGTNCVAHGALSHQQVAPAFTPVHLRLSIQGTVVSEWYTGGNGDPDAVRPKSSVGPQPNVTSAETALICRFDSTHFANGTSITVKFEAWGAEGRYVSASGNAPAVNSALSFGRHEWEASSNADAHGAGNTATLLPSLNIAVPSSNLVTSLGWKSSAFYSALQSSGASIVYINTHGESQGHSDGTMPYGPNLSSDHDELYPPPSSGTMTYTDDDFIYGTTYSSGSILDSMQTAVGSGKPPFNSSGRPPIWFAMNDTCDTGANNDFASAYLWPYTNAYNNNLCEDQSEMGWSKRVYVGSQVTITSELWSDFGLGFDADNVRLKVYRRYAEWYDQNMGDPTLMDKSDEAARAMLHVYGDLYTRLHGVYTGSAGSVTTWYR